MHGAGGFGGTVFDSFIYGIWKGISLYLDNDSMTLISYNFVALSSKRFDNCADVSPLDGS